MRQLHQFAVDAHSGMKSCQNYTEAVQWIGSFLLIAPNSLGDFSDALALLPEFEHSQIWKRPAGDFLDPALGSWLTHSIADLGFFLRLGLFRWLLGPNLLYRSRLTLWFSL